MPPKKQPEKLNISGELVRDGFVGAEAGLKAVIDLLVDAGLDLGLSEPVAILYREVEEFYSNATFIVSKKTIKTHVGGTYIRLTASGLSTALKMNLLSEDEDEISSLGTSQALKWCSYPEKLYGSLHRIKMNQCGKLLADIVGKVLLCKHGSHDRISKDMFDIMIRIFLKKKTDWGEVLFEKIKESIKTPHFGRIISLYLVSSLNDEIDESFGAPIHYTKKISLKTVERWERTFSKSVKKRKSKYFCRGMNTLEEEEGEDAVHVEPATVEAEISLFKGKRVRVEERVASPIYIPVTHSLMEEVMGRDGNQKGSDIPSSSAPRSQEEPSGSMIDQMRILLAEQRRYFENYVDKALEKVKEEVSIKMDAMKDDIDHINAQITSWFTRVASTVDDNYKTLKSLNEKLEGTPPEHEMIVGELECAIAFLTEKITAIKNDALKKNR